MTVTLATTRALKITIFWFWHLVTSKTMINLHQIPQHSIPEDSISHAHCHKNLKFYKNCLNSVYSGSSNQHTVSFTLPWNSCWKMFKTAYQIPMYI